MSRSRIRLKAVPAARPAPAKDSGKDGVMEATEKMGLDPEEADQLMEAAREIDEAEAEGTSEEMVEQPSTDDEGPHEGDVVTVKIAEQLVQATFREWSKYPNVAKVFYGGRIHFRNLYVDGVINKPRPIGAGSAAGDQIARMPAQKASRFDANERFDFIDVLVDMVLVGDSKSLIVSGSPGLGKTYEVMQRIRAANLTDVDDFEENEGVEDLGLDGETMLGDYKVIKGMATPKSLYKQMWLHKNRILVFDDCDSIWDYDTSKCILKAGLDSYDRRRISWLSMRKDEDLPQTFEFEGKIIFISNRALSQLDPAVLSRCLYVDVSMTPREKIDRIRKVAVNIKPEMDPADKGEAIELIASLMDDIGDLNIRTLLKVLEIRAAGGERWKDVAEYVITAM